MAQFPAAENLDIDKNRFADLWRMCREGQLDQLKETIQFDRDILTYFNLRTQKGVTLLHEAVDAEQPDVVQLLLLHGVSPDLRARGGLTPLHVAVSKCSVGCVRALIENGADISMRDESGQDAIAKAELRSKKREAVLKLLRSKGERVIKKLLFMRGVGLRHACQLGSISDYWHYFSLFCSQKSSYSRRREL